jgi:ADP-ribose pyrophosphatase
MPDLEWELISSRYALQDQWIRLRADTYGMPDGEVIEPFYVLECPPWVNVVALTQEGKVVLVRQYRPGSRTVTLELPGGAANPDDPTPLHAIRRELREETGYGGGDFIELGALWPNPASQNNAVHSFLATGVERIAAMEPDDSEFLDVVQLPLGEVIALARNGGLAHALHVAALFLALSRLDRSA